MLKKSRVQFFLTVLVVGFLFSCAKTNVEGPAGPPGTDGPDGSSTLSGTVFGKIVLYDSLGNALTDNSGATIAFENTSPQVSIISAVDGSFNSPVLSYGLYNLNISKPGYGAMELNHFLNTGGATPSQAGVITLGKNPSSWFDIKNLKVDTITENSFHYMYITITLVHPQILPNAWAVVYFRHIPGASNMHSDYTYRTVFYQLDDSTLVFSPFDQDLTEFTDQFNNTDYVYMAVAIDNPRLFTYTDSTGNKVYPATGNLSNEVKVYNNLKN